MTKNMKIKKALKNRKNMKGGYPVAETVPAGELVKGKYIPEAQVVGGGSSYQRYTDNLYIKLVLALGIMGVLWLILSRSLIRHKYSEVLSYSLMAASVLVSLLLILITGVKQIKAAPGFLGALIKFKELFVYLFSSSTG